MHIYIYMHMVVLLGYCQEWLTIFFRESCMSRLTRTKHCLEVSDVSGQIKYVLRLLLFHCFNSLAFSSARFLYVFELLFGKRASRIFFLESSFCSWEFCFVSPQVYVLCNYISGIKMSNFMYLDVTLGPQIHLYCTDAELIYNRCHFVNHTLLYYFIK